MIGTDYKAQVDLLLRVLPLISKESDFALKGGTAINLFLRNMPRLSVDIDLTFLPILGREETFTKISSAISRLKNSIESSLSGTKVIPKQTSGTPGPTTFTVDEKRIQIKVEINFVLRGSVYQPSIQTLAEKAQTEFNSLIRVNCLSTPDIYAGKLCAALDRQHPRDLFDVKELLENEGITDDIRKAFVVYLASHSRPMNELLAPNFKDISTIYEQDFVGMTTEPIELQSLLETRERLVSIIKSELIEKERLFLISMKEGSPNWKLLEIEEIEKLPGLQWKLNNINKMDSNKREVALDKLKKALSF
jgi:predicted nucleotidyltransferase component of viral defense system